MLAIRRPPRVVSHDLNGVRGAGDHCAADQELPFRAASFDAVTAFMSLMDVADPERTLREVARVLRPGGFVQFSVVHPILSAPVGRWVDDETGKRQARAIGEYFYQGPLVETWTF